MNTEVSAADRIARVLQVDKHILLKVHDRLKAVTGKEKVMESIMAENDREVGNRLGMLDISDDPTAREVYDALIERIAHDDSQLCGWLGCPSSLRTDDWQRVLDRAQEVAGAPQGFFLKKEKAVQLLENIPPQNVLKVLGYETVAQMLSKEDLFEVFSALRFIEGSQWLNDVFFKQYEKLTPDDFEHRAVTTRALPARWLALAENFTKKKHHNISHLKELGVIFTLPLSLDVKGEVIRNFSLLLHYFNEIPFYSSLFERFAKEPETFAKKIISLLSGQVIENPLTVQNEKSQWLIVQRYLSKDDENDWRLFVPHLNPEALHWDRAERILTKATATTQIPVNLSFWKDMNWVGDFFKTDTGVPILVSFNLIDTAMSLVKRKDLLKYLYHHQESLWNKIYASYFSEEEMEQVMKDHIIDGWFEV